MQPDKLYCHVVEQCLPFIRCAALFYHFLTGVVSPATLSDKGKYLKSFVRLSLLDPLKLICDSSE